MQMIFLPAVLVRCYFSGDTSFVLRSLDFTQTTQTNFSFFIADETETAETKSATMKLVEAKLRKSSLRDKKSSVQKPMILWRVPFLWPL